ncbi:MAG: caspase family protein [Desulfobacteraceae bacterium]|nr:MAG: caspase family protein [Desulfobacteraceae bacterium]
MELSAMIKTKKLCFSLALLLVITGPNLLSVFGAQTSLRIKVSAPSPSSQKETDQSKDAVAKHQESQTVPSLFIDVERDIPAGQEAGPFDLAVVIANGNYTVKGIPNVVYAYRDALIMKEYFIRTFGIKPENIMEVRDATKGTFETLFGTVQDHRGKLHDWVKAGVSRVFIYYSGHGAPSQETGEGYFVPSDADPDYISKSGYPLSVFYANLNALPAKETVVVLDACFSGRTQDGLLFKNVSPSMLRVRDVAAGLQRGAVLTSSQGDQMSTWYPDKQHSLFTYYFLKALQGGADGNQDKVVTVGEMSGYLSEHVPYWAGRIAGKRQEPRMEGDPNLVLVRFN